LLRYIILIKIIINFNKDEKFEFAKKLKLPLFKVEGMDLIKKRSTLILKDNEIVKYFYPIFPPTKNVEDVIEYFQK
tara:strand:+ start:1119 stop:1346 length:228 start_codon:yes stop_codon:yes gene_type:complete